MSLRSILLVAVLLLTIAFVAANWTTVTQPTDLSLLFTSIRAPLGLVLVALMSVLAAVFLGFITSMLFDVRKQSKELSAQRDLADKAEASRLLEMKTQTQDRLERLASQLDHKVGELDQQLGRMEDRLTQRLEEHANSIAAAVGVVDERLSGAARGTSASREVPALPASWSQP